MATLRNISLARRLRRAANRPEDAAWAALRSLRRDGFPVRRQHPIDRYVADFAIIKARLVIEIDGGVHALPQVAVRDVERTEALETLGWRVLRVSAQDALDGDGLRARVQAELGL